MANVDGFILSLPIIYYLVAARNRQHHHVFVDDVFEEAVDEAVEHQASAANYGRPDVRPVQALPRCAPLPQPSCPSKMAHALAQGWLERTPSPSRIAQSPIRYSFHNRF